MQDETLNLSASRFDVTTGKWQSIQPSSEHLDRDSLTLATFNIWFGNYYMEARYNAIANLLQAHQPDIIALQEVTINALDQFLEQQWIRENYLTTDIDGSTLSDYGVLILSRLPLKTITLKALPSTMRRRLLLVETAINGNTLCIGTVHLESMKSSDFIREIQLETIFETLADKPNAVLMGDFNFCASWHEENERIDPAYHEVWSLLRDEPGYTEDTTINRMRHQLKGEHKQVRFDRVLLKSQTPDSGWAASSIDLLGTAPISPDHPGIFPSDHFGLVCRISKR